MQTTFLCLPNEILTKFFENLSMTDRQSLSSINNRLCKIEKRTGHRRFDIVDCSNIFIIAYFASGRKTFSSANPTLDVEAFFSRASTRVLKISGPMDDESEMMLFAFSRTITFKKIVHKLIRQRQSIDLLFINFKEDLIYLECAKNLWMNLPLMKSCQIFPAILSIQNNQQSILDDDAFLHLIRSCSKRLSLSWFPTRLTTSGIAKAFEVVCNSRPNLSVTMHMQMDQFDPFFRSLAADPRYEAKFGVAKHIDSGATLECDNSKIYRMREITMRGSEIPIR